MSALAAPLGGAPAGGLNYSMQVSDHDAVAYDDAATFTPQLVPGAGVTRPRGIAVAVSQDTVYVGGQFAQVSDGSGTIITPRQHLFAFDRYTGEIRNWAPAVNGEVWALHLEGDDLYIGGDFTTVNGESRPRVAKVSAQTGDLDAGFQPPINYGRVAEIALVNDRLIVGGAFGPRLLALDPATGANTGYIGNSITGNIGDEAGQIFNFAVNPQGTRLVAVGNFTQVDGSPRSRVFMLNLGDQASELNDFHYLPFEDRCRSNNWHAYVRDVDFSPSGEWFGVVSAGYVTAETSQIGTHVCDAVARFEVDDPAPTAPTWINYTGGDTLFSLAITDAAVYLQGHNRWLNNPQGRDSAGPGAVDALGGGVVDPETGQALAWDGPHGSREGGRSIAVVDDGVWLVNDSQKFDWQDRYGIQFLPLPASTPPEPPEVQHSDVVGDDAAPTTPQVAPTAAVGRPRVTAMAVSDDIVIAGGHFESVTSSDGATQYARNNLFAFDRSSGEVLDWQLPVDGQVWALKVVGDQLYVGGDFATIGGQTRPSIAKVDIATAQVDVSFQPNVSGGRVWDIEYTGGRLIVSGAFGPRIVALDPALGVDTGYITSQISGNYPGQGRQVFATSVSPDGSSLAAVGSFTDVDGQSRPRFFMLDLGTDAATLSSQTFAAFGQECAQDQSAYLNDIDFGPDGSWFVVGAGGGVVSDPSQVGSQVCSAAARFDVGSAEPTWVNYTGGQAITSVLAPGPAVYVQGASRWLDNPDGNGNAGPGAVNALGGGAIDAETGSALPFDGPHGSGHGGWEMVATDDGLWLGNDSSKFDWQDRYGIQFLPLDPG